VIEERVRIARAVDIVDFPLEEVHLKKT